MRGEGSQAVRGVLGSEKQAREFLVVESTGDGMDFRHPGVCVRGPTSRRVHRVSLGQNIAFLGRGSVLMSWRAYE